MLKHLEKYLQLFIFISFSSAPVFSQVVFSDFRNNSDYKGKWNLEKSVPVYLADYLRDKYGIITYTPSTFWSLFEDVEEPDKMFEDFERLSPYIKQINATHYVSGSIEFFDVSRYNFSEPTVAGYEHYSSIIRISLKIYNVEKSITEFSDLIEGKIDKGSLGINLFGRPSEDKLTFYSLDNLEFGSEQFNGTIVGLAMKDLCESLVREYRYRNQASFRELRAAAAKQKNEDTQLLKGPSKILRGDVLITDELTGEVFINLGGNELKQNDILFVYQPDSPLTDPSTGEILGRAEIKVGEIKVTDIRGPKLSLCKIIRSDSEIKKGMIVKKIAENE
ncbi:MAG: hypothetical protein HUU54_02925 [Ignavibacteriaceae bacterium]|nr:hypothetical protein [Ignavibacteriaceae bacterium]